MEENYDKLSLVDKWKRHYNRSGPRPVKDLVLSARLSTAVFLYTAVTQLYCIIFHVIPFCFQGYSDAFLYCLKISACFVFVNSMANWLCARFYTSEVKSTKDRPRLMKTLWDPERGEDVDGDAPNLEDYCQECCLSRPPLAHHCIECRKCIFKRDHHCYMLGVCIGYYNQRYFIVLCLYVAVACIVGQYFIGQYVWAHVIDAKDGGGWYAMLPHSATWGFFSGKVALHVWLMIYHCYVLWLVGLTALGNFGWQIAAVSRGVTMHQFRNNITPSCRKTATESFRDVFGDLWGLNFFLPAHILFRQKPAAAWLS